MPHDAAEQKPLTTPPPPAAPDTTTTQPARASHHTTITPRSWPHEQLRRLGELRRAERRDPTSTWLAYWCSDHHGRPANHTCETDPREWTARPGLMQEVPGPLKPCSAHALHATREPHRWQGCRVWIVALLGERRNDDKGAALRREIVGEVLPEDCHGAPQVGVRIGRKDLSGASLDGASLVGARLVGASLDGARLDGASLVGARLDGARLVGARLDGASLVGAYRLPTDPAIPGWIVVDGLLRRAP